MGPSLSRGRADLMRVVSIYSVTWYHMSFRLEDAWPEAPIPLLLLSGGFARLAPALLGLMSGMLLGQALLKYPNKQSVIARRATTLLVPYLFWNFFAVALALCAVYILGKQTPAGLLSFNSLFGVTHWPFNFPLHYLIDILKCALVFTALHSVLGGRPLVLAAISCALVAALIAASPPALVNTASALPRVDSTIYFTLGALLGVTPNLPGRIMSLLLRRQWLVLAVTGIGFVSSAMIYPETLLSLLMRTTFGGFFFLLVFWRAPEPPRWVSSRLALRLLCTHVITFMTINAIFDVESNPTIFWWLFQPAAALFVAWASIAIERRLGVKEGLRALMERGGLKVPQSGGAAQTPVRR